LLKLTLERKKKGLTQKQVAEQIGITDRTYRRIEAGEQGPSYIVLKKIEDLYGLESPHRKFFIEVCEDDNNINLKKKQERREEK